MNICVIRNSHIHTQREYLAPEYCDLISVCEGVLILVHYNCHGNTDWQAWRVKLKRPCFSTIKIKYYIHNDIKIASLSRQEPQPTGTAKWPITLRFEKILGTTSVVRSTQNPQDVLQKIQNKRGCLGSGTPTNCKTRKS